MGLFKRRRGSGGTLSVTIVSDGVFAPARTVPSMNGDVAVMIDEVAEERGLELIEIDVVGESNYQDALERLAGTKTEDSKRHLVGVTLRCEPTNSFDPNAVRVEAMGQLLGYIPRATASHLSGSMIGGCGGILEGVGVIVGGWRDGVSEGSFGIRVWVDRAALGRIGVDERAVRRS